MLRYVEASKWSEWLGSCGGDMCDWCEQKALRASAVFSGYETKSRSSDWDSLRQYLDDHQVEVVVIVEVDHPVPCCDRFLI